VALFVNPHLIVLLAAEPSADALGAALARVLRDALPDVRLVGMAGPQMRAEGVEALWQMEEVSVMGLWEVLKHYPRLRRLQRSVMRSLTELRPSFVLGIDGPDFNLPIEAHLKRHAISVYHFVAPTVWAWRAGRAAKLAQQTDGLLCLFPFEPPYFLLHDLRAVAVGHPLADRLPFVPEKSLLRQQFHVKEEATVLALLPGSRSSEWRYHAPAFFETVALLSQQYPHLQVFVPCLHEKMRAYFAAFVGDLPVTLVLSPRGASEILTMSDVALVVSGTATLEAALCHTPMVIAYRMHPLSWFIMSHLAKTAWAGLPNILANARIVPEYLQEEMQAPALSVALSHLLSENAAKQAQLTWFDQLHRLLAVNTAQSAVDTLLEWWREDIKH
jgi:lipid-A-disaccharide synthase